MSERAFRIAAAGLVLLALLPQFLSRTIPDTAWLLHVADRVAGGARLYVDLVDVNPPLVVWLDLPIVLAARWLGVSDLLLYRVAVSALVLGSVMASGRLLRRLLPDEPPARLRVALLAMLFVTLTLSREDFGEREHLMLALVLPYVMLTAIRLRGAAVPSGTVAAVGLAAGLGIALKPYFVALWLALEACLLLRQRRAYRPRPEALAVVAVGAVYLAAVARWSPEYFDVVRLMAGPYYTFLSNSLPVTGLLGDGAAIPLAALLCWVALRRDAERPDLWAVLAFATFGLYLSAVLQHKGWRYHFYPSMATGLLLLGLMPAHLRRPVRGLAARLYAYAAMGVTALVAGWTAVACIVQIGDPLHRRYDADPDLSRLVPVVRERAGERGILVLSWSMASTFPLVTYSGTRSVSRFNHLWIPAAVYHEGIYAEPPLRYRERSAMGALERYVNDAVVEDFAQGRPGLLLVLRPAPDRRRWGLRRLDFLAYFGRDPRFAALFARYRYSGTIGEYWLFERLPEDAPDEPPRRRRSETSTTDKERS